MLRVLGFRVQGSPGSIQGRLERKLGREVVDDGFRV